MVVDLLARHHVMPGVATFGLSRSGHSALKRSHWSFGMIFRDKWPGQRRPAFRGIAECRRVSEIEEKRP